MQGCGFWDLRGSCREKPKSKVIDRERKWRRTLMETWSWWGYRAEEARRGEGRGSFSNQRPRSAGMGTVCTGLESDRLESKPWSCSSVVIKPWEIGLNSLSANHHVLNESCCEGEMTGGVFGGRPGSQQALKKRCHDFIKQGWWVTGSCPTAMCYCFDK